MVTPQQLSVGFVVVSGLLSLGLLVVAVRAYQRERIPAMAFVAGAFTVFMLKNFFVAYALYTDAVEHEVLELMDAVGDLATVLLLTFPFLWPQR